MAISVTAGYILPPFCAGYYGWGCGANLRTSRPDTTSQSAFYSCWCSLTCTSTNGKIRRRSGNGQLGQSTMGQLQAPGVIQIASQGMTFSCFFLLHDWCRSEADVCIGLRKHTSADEAQSRLHLCRQSWLTKSSSYPDTKYRRRSTSAFPNPRNSSQLRCETWSAANPGLPRVAAGIPRRTRIKRRKRQYEQCAVSWPWLGTGSCFPFYYSSDVFLQPTFSGRQITPVPPRSIPSSSLTT